MNTRTLGDLRVSALGYGAMVLVHGMYGDNDDDRSVDTLRHAIDAGAFFIDTSDGYGPDGHNERLVGRAIEDRDDAVVATKWGIVLEPGSTAHKVEASFANEIWVDARPERAREAAEASLERLGVEALDLWYLHFPDPGVPVEETVGAMGELVAEGKVRQLGLCNVAEELELTPAQLALAWLLHQGDHIVPIPGTRTPSHLDENLAAADVTLDAETLARIDDIAPAGAAAGAALV